MALVSSSSLFSMLPQNAVTSTFDYKHVRRKRGDKGSKKSDIHLAQLSFGEARKKELQWRRGVQQERGD